MSAVFHLLLLLQCLDSLFLLQHSLSRAMSQQEQAWLPTGFHPSLRNVTPSSFESREPLAILDFHTVLFRFLELFGQKNYLSWVILLFGVN